MKAYERLILTILFAVLIGLVVVLCISPKGTPTLPCEAELLMPGNTVVMGTCTKFNRISSGWAKAEIDGKTYSCKEWRIVLRGN